MFTAFNYTSHRVLWVARMVCVILVWSLLAILPHSGFAATTNYTWDGNAPGGTGNSKWTTANNWGVPDSANRAPPGNGSAGLLNSDISFGGTLKATPQMDINYFIHTLTFNSGAGAFTLVSQQNPPNAETLTIGAGGIVNQSANSQTINSPLVLGASHSWNANAGAIQIGGPVSLGSYFLTVSGASGTTAAGTISGSGGILKSGSGTLNLTGNNSYSGGTTINDGRLAVNNTSGSGAGTANVTINSGGMLGGNGTISGGLTLNSGGALAPGNNVGQLNTGTETWNGGSTILWEINDVDAGAGMGWDRLNISGALDIAAASGNKVFIDVRSLTLANAPGLVNDFVPSQSYIWTIAKSVSGISFVLGGNESTVFELLLGGFYNGLDGGSFSLATANESKDLNLVFTPAMVPEPRIAVLMALVAGGLWLARRNRSLRQ